MMDLVWAFPVILLAICVSTVLLTSPNGLKFGPIHLVANSLWLPTLIIAVDLRAVRVQTRPRPCADRGQ